MAITILYVILGISAVLLLWVATALFLRIRRLSRASRTQFRLAVTKESPGEQTGEHAASQP